MADSEPGGEIARNELRASHDDRDRVVELLRVSAGDGRLTAAELDQRLELALTAQTYGELAKLVTDLPAAGSVASAPAVARKPKEIARIECRSGHMQRVDRWLVPQRMEVKVTSGNVLLDLTQAIITQSVLRLDIDVSSGSVKLKTKPGIVVDAEDVAIRSGQVKVRAPWSADTPELLRVEVTGKVGSGQFLAAPPRRTFWQWLTRQPQPYAALIAR